MEQSTFSKGVAYYRASGGQNLDELTLEIWWGQVQGIDPKHWERAVKQVCDRTDLNTLNFIAEVKALVREMARKELNEARQQKALPGPDDIPVSADEFKRFKNSFFREFGKGGKGPVSKASPDAAS